MNRHGSIILHVLVIGVVVALIAACLLRVTMMRYVLTARSANAAVERRADEGAVATILTCWSHTWFACPTGNCYGSVSCANNVPSYTCSPSATTPANQRCDCTCTPNAGTGLPTVQASAPGGTSLAGACNLSVVSDDLMSNTQSGNGAFTW